LSTPGSERRREPREPFSGQVSVKLTVRTTSVVAAGLTRRVCVEVFSRNLSPSGFGFLAPPLYLPESAAGSGIALRGQDVFEVGKLVEIAIVRSAGPPRWMLARVLRARVVDDGFVECGVEFV
jgi:PilZ domain-containing protein